MLNRWINAAILALCAFAGLTWGDSQNLNSAMIVAESSTVDPVTGDIQFQIEFDSVPDFHSVDPHRR